MRELMLHTDSVMYFQRWALESKSEAFESLSMTLNDLSGMTGMVHGRVTADLTNVLEGTAKFISVAAIMGKSSSFINWANLSRSVKPILERCTTATEDGVVQRL